MFTHDIFIQNQHLHTSQSRTVKKLHINNYYQSSLIITLEIRNEFKFPCKINHFLNSVRVIVIEKIIFFFKYLFIQNIWFKFINVVWNSGVLR